MNKALAMAKEKFLIEGDLSEKKLQTILGNMMGPGIEFSELFFQSTCYESWFMEDSIIKEGSFDMEEGVGVRAISGEKTGFAYANCLDFSGIKKASEAARAIARSGETQTVCAHSSKALKPLYPTLHPMSQLTDAEKIKLLQQVDQEARRIDPRVTQVMASLSGAYEIVWIMASDGTYAADVRPMVRMGVNVIVDSKGRRESGHAGGGGRTDYRYFIEDNRALEFAREAVREALINLEAMDAPAGMMPVILGPGWPGVLLHEAIGHGLEGDFNRKKTSAFWNRMGERIATPVCTVVDDGTLENRRGSLSIDDEGTPSQCTVLVENGILKNFMQDKLNARLMGVVSTGNGRRESFSSLPLPRMTNTYLLPGNTHPDEMISTVSRGIFAVNFGGGQVDITSGKFVFSASESYLIENGKITVPLKGVTLIGDGPSVLQQVSMVGNDLKLDPGIGVCGKDGQSVPVGVGQPTLKVDSMTVGGTVF